MLGEAMARLLSNHAIVGWRFRCRVEQRQPNRQSGESRGQSQGQLSGRHKPGAGQRCVASGHRIASWVKVGTLGHMGRSTFREQEKGEKGARQQEPPATGRCAGNLCIEIGRIFLPRGPSWK